MKGPRDTGFVSPMEARAAARNWAAYREALADARNAEIALSEGGFFSLPAARMALHRLKVRRSLKGIEALIPTLLDHLDHASETPGHTGAVDVEGGVELADGNVARGVGRKTIGRVEGDDVSEEQLLQGADLVLQFLNSLLKALGHGRFSFNHSDSPEATPAEPAAHRLSESASRT